MCAKRNRKGRALGSLDPPECPHLYLRLQTPTSETSSTLDTFCPTSLPSTACRNCLDILSSLEHGTHDTRLSLRNILSGNQLHIPFPRLMR